MKHNNYNLTYIIYKKYLMSEKTLTKYCLCILYYIFGFITFM